MTSPRSTVLARIGWSLTLLGGVGGLVVRLAWPAPILPTTFGVGPTALVAIAALGITWSTMGTLLVVRRPTNPIGRLMIVVGFVHATSVLTVAVAFGALAQGTVAGRDVASIAGALTALLSPTLVLVFYLAFTFPTGRGHTPLWNTIGHIYLWVTMILAALLVLQPGDVHLLPGIHNPIGFGPDLRPVFGERVAGGVAAVAAALVGPLMILSLLSRYRVAGPIERQQLKWFILGAAVTIGALLVMATGVALTQGPVGETPLVVFALASTSVPVAVGIAILRYRLYEIDRIVSRTIAYAIVSAILSIVFGGMILLLLAALAPYTQGQAIAVAASTLTAFAIFQPVLHRVRRDVDRRFNRARYDAERTAADFSARIRDEVDIAAVTNDLHATVVGAVNPAVLGLWIRETRVGPPRFGSSLVTESVSRGSP